MLQKDTFNELRKIVYAESGISLSDRKMALVSARVNKRLRALKLSTYEDYLKVLINDSSKREMVNFLNVISTNTTHFFRESAHFDFLASQLEKWKDQGQQKFRIWCAASSSGEEPYTIGMVMKESLKNIQNTDIKILATDISTDILQTASNGIYDTSKLENIPSFLKKQYFSKINEEDYQVSRELRNQVTFKRLNLSTPPFPMKGPLDIVFCRNVMIYFDNPVRQRLVNEIHRLLRPGGFLIIGHSESLNNITTSYKPVQPAVYQKK